MQHTNSNANADEGTRDLVAAAFGTTVAEAQGLGKLEGEILVVGPVPGTTEYDDLGVNRLALRGWIATPTRVLLLPFVCK